MDCREFLDAWLDLRQGSSQLELADGPAALLRDHASSCDKCAQLERRMRITVGLLVTLETRSAPEELGEAIGVELGEDLELRTEMRVARIFKQLTPLASPKALDERVAGLFPRKEGRAPAALDRLVDEVLRSDAPREPLDQDERDPFALDLDDLDLEAVEPEVPRRVDLQLRGGRVAPKRRRKPILVGALLGLAFGWMGAVTLERVSHPPVVVAGVDKVEGVYSFKVVVHDSFESLRSATPALSELTDIASRMTGDQL
ncbi:MAG: hypothetical protein ACI8QC_000509 [Planctomycetota bacterium]|jgi:hypothetical protein